MKNIFKDIFKEKQIDEKEQLREVIKYSQEVEDLINNHAFLTTFEMLEKKTTDRLLSADINDEKEILKIHLKSKIIKEVKEELIDALASGIYAQNELQEILEQE